MRNDSQRLGCRAANQDGIGLDYRLAGARQCCLRTVHLGAQGEWGDALPERRENLKLAALIWVGALVRNFVVVCHFEGLG